MRLLLMKQDRITLLEQELSRLDKEEEAELFLGNVRRDKNSLRNDVLERLDGELGLYGKFQHLSVAMPIVVSKSIKPKLEQQASISNNLVSKCLASWIDPIS
jgi:hypothetical protein